jgi:predicted O-methyltransferase YrrM
MSFFNDPALDALLARLHGQSTAQSKETAAYFGARGRERQPIAADDADKKNFMSDKLVALDADKARFCYQLCRAMNAHRAIEAGTSYGVSTLYLAAALRENARAQPGKYIVIGTEYEPRKAAAARKHFEEAGLAGFVDLREGDLLETLVDVGSPVDFMLIDIWTRMARPAIELVAPCLRTGAVVICDNTQTYRAEYEDYFAFITDPSNGFSTMTLPFAGGLEMSVRG